MLSAFFTGNIFEICGYLFCIASIGFLLAIFQTGNKDEIILAPMEMPNKAKTTKKLGLIKLKSKPSFLTSEALTELEIRNTQTVDKMKLTNAMMNDSE